MSEGKHHKIIFSGYASATSIKPVLSSTSKAMNKSSIRRSPSIESLDIRIAHQTWLM